jgi:hypothetical protein
MVPGLVSGDTEGGLTLCHSVSLLLCMIMLPVEGRRKSELIGVMRGAECFGTTSSCAVLRLVHGCARKICDCIKSELLCKSISIA